MKRVLVVGEDRLCCALGERLVEACLPGWTLARESIDAQGRTKLLPALPRYAQQAQHVQPVLCVADTDGDCASALVRRWFDGTGSARLLFRLAVTEAESWLLADREGAAQALGVALARLPHRPDELADPTRLVLTLAARSRSRVIRDEMVSQVDRNKPGSGYNLHLVRFARTAWDAHRAARLSPSLARAVSRISQFEAIV